MKEKSGWLSRIWHRANRGLLAACLLSLALSAYVIVDGAVFQQQKVEIERAVREYVERSPQLAVLPSSFSNANQKNMDSAVEEKMRQNEEILRRYWSFRTDEWGYNQGQTLLNHVREVVGYNAKNSGSIESAKGIVQYVNSVVKTGRDEAEISFSYTGSVKYTGNVKWVVFNASPVEKNDEFNLYLSIGDVNSAFASESVSPSGDVRAIMVKREGRWVIDRVTYANVYTGN